MRIFPVAPTGEPVPVEKQMDRAAFEAAAVSTESLPCPHCGIRRPYDKGNCYFASDVSGPGSPFDDLLG